MEAAGRPCLSSISNRSHLKSISLFLKTPIYSSSSNGLPLQMNRPSRMLFRSRTRKTNQLLRKGIPKISHQCRKLELRNLKPSTFLNSRLKQCIPRLGNSRSRLSQSRSRQITDMENRTMVWTSSPHLLP